jgi:hypothetical protein
MFGDKYSKVATYVSTDSSGTTTLQQEVDWKWQKSLTEYDSRYYIRFV